MSRRRSTHCPQGHPRTPENITANRSCRICKSKRMSAKYWADKNAAQPPAPNVEAARHACNVAGLTHYIQRRRQRLTRQKLAA